LKCADQWQAFDQIDFLARHPHKMSSGLIVPVFQRHGKLLTSMSWLEDDLNDEQKFQRLSTLRYMCAGTPSFLAADFVFRRFQHAVIQSYGSTPLWCVDPPGEDHILVSVGYPWDNNRLDIKSIEPINMSEHKNNVALSAKTVIVKQSGKQKTKQHHAKPKGVVAVKIKAFDPSKKHASTNAKKKHQPQKKVQGKKGGTESLSQIKAMQDKGASNIALAIVAPGKVPPITFPKPFPVGSCPNKSRLNFGLPSIYNATYDSTHEYSGFFMNMIFSQPSAVISSIDNTGNINWSSTGPPADYESMINNAELLKINAVGVTFLNVANNLEKNGEAWYMNVNPLDGSGSVIRPEKLTDITSNSLAETVTLEQLGQRSFYVTPVRLSQADFQLPTYGSSPQQLASAFVIIIRAKYQTTSLTLNRHCCTIGYLLLLLNPSLRPRAALSRKIMLILPCL